MMIDANLLLFLRTMENIAPVLENLFKEFVDLIKESTGETFQSFKTSKHIDATENYKYQIHEDARNALRSSEWKPENIGSGKIQAALSSSIKSSVRYNGKTHNNNLIDWRKKDEFSRRPASNSLEMALYEFFKNKISPETAFNLFLTENLPYQFIAYLFFLNHKDVFLPISQEKFDAIFEILGRSEFKTRNRVSWENYSEFCSIVKQVRDFLKTKDKGTTLLDAHSFLWIMGNRKKEAGGAPEEPGTHSESSNRAHPNESTVEAIVPESKATVLTKEQWEEILANPELTKELDLEILQALFSFHGHEASATQIGTVLGQTGEAPQSLINLEVGRYAKRIAERYPVQFTPRSEEKDKYWDFFFNGRYKGQTFIWQLKPELAGALISTGLTGEHIFPDELPTDSLNLWPEGLKKAVLVNIYERNPKARQACIDCYGYICTICEFDFEKAYGKLGERFIHVHHLKPISQIGKEYRVDPINDLRPVCPNCHAMLHRGPETLSIEELKNLLPTAREAKIDLAE